MLGFPLGTYVDGEDAQGGNLDAAFGADQVAGEVFKVAFEQALNVADRQAEFLSQGLDDFFLRVGHFAEFVSPALNPRK